MTERTGRRDKGTTAIDNDRAIFIKERSGNSERSEATERIALLSEAIAAGKREAAANER